RDLRRMECDQERKRDPEGSIRGERRRTKSIVSLKFPHTRAELRQSAVAEGQSQYNGFAGFWNPSGIHSRKYEGGQCESGKPEWSGIGTRRRGWGFIAHDGASDMLTVDPKK